MQKILIVMLVAVGIVYMFGCGKKQESMEGMNEPISMETFSTVTTPASVQPEGKAAEPRARPGQVPSVQAVGLEPMLPAGPYRPTAIEIQTALKNAGFYTGVVDGKAGPMTKKAIEEFQRANNLQVDGRIGPKTWGVLAAYLNPAVPAAKEPKKRR